MWVRLKDEHISKKIGNKTKIKKNIKYLCRWSQIIKTLWVVAAAFPEVEGIYWYTWIQSMWEQPGSFQQSCRCWKTWCSFFCKIILSKEQETGSFLGTIMHAWGELPDPIQLIHTLLRTCPSPRKFTLSFNLQDINTWNKLCNKDWKVFMVSCNWWLSNNSYVNYILI